MTPNDEPHEHDEPLDPAESLRLIQHEQSQPQRELRPDPRLV